MILKNAAKPESNKVKTKGKFSESEAHGPNVNFSRDIGWIKKANPEAAAAEKAFMAREEELMEKRRFQKIIQNV